MGHTLEAVSSRLCKGTESDLVLAAYSLPSQFQHTFIQNVIERKFCTRCSSNTTTNLIDNCESLSLVTHTILSLSLQEQGIGITPDHQVVVEAILLGSGLVKLILLHSGTSTLHGMRVIDSSEIHLYSQWHILQWLVSGTVLYSFSCLLHIILVGIEVEFQTRVRISRSIAIYQHLLLGRAGSIPALVTDGTTMVIMQGAHDVVILYLIVNTIIRAGPDILHGILVGYNEVVGIARLQAVTQAGNLVGTIDCCFPRIASFTIQSNVYIFAHFRNRLSLLLAGSSLAALVCSYKGTVAGWSGIIDGIDRCIDGTLSHTHICHSLGDTAIIFTFVLTLTV